MKKIAVLFMVLLLVLSSLIGCKAAETATTTTPQTQTEAKAPKAAKEEQKVEDPIVIGAILSMTGSLSSYGEYQYNGAVLAVEDINAKGGVLGRPLELKVFDDGGDSSTAVAGAQKFVNDPTVSLVFGCVTSGASLAVAPVLEAENTLMMASSATAMDLLQHKNFFRTANDSGQQAIFVAKWAYEDFGKTCVIVGDNNDWGLDTANAFEKEFTTNGGTVLSTELVDPASSDFRSAITRLGALDADFVYIACQMDATAAFLTQANELSYDITRVGSPSLLNEDFLKVAGSDANGIMFFTEFFPYNTAPEVVAFAEEHKARFDGAMPSQQTAGTYEAIVFASKAIEKAGSADRKAILDAAYEVEGFQGITGWIEYDGNALKVKDYTKLTVKDQQFVLYEK